MHRSSTAVTGLVRAAITATVLLLTVSAFGAPGLAVAAPDTGSAGSGSADTDRVDPNNYAVDCPDILIVAVSGATDSEEDRNPLAESGEVWSNWVGNVTVPTGEANKGEPGTVGWMYVPYPSTYGLGLLQPVPTYQDSMVAGVASTNRILDENKAKCGDDTKFVLLGYSVGAEVVERVARELGHRDSNALVTADDIAGVALIGDPYRPAGTPSMGEPGPPGGGFMSSEPADYGALDGKITYACRPYDIACDAPQEIAVLELALGVLGQMHFTLLNPGQTVSDFANAVSSMAARSIVHIVTHEDWFASDESFLDVLRKVADQTYDPDGPDRNIQLSQEQIVEALNWAMGPGSEVVKAKLADEGPGFVEDNRDVFELVIKPYIFLGFIEHLFYWNNNPNDPWYWESEKVVDWITALAHSEKDRKAPAASSAPGN
ncbi:cutinase family protein [Rhodococcus sp. NPDC127530]|uniref:cutinase family protein n=1 Tax=unclassified Rhodococcus (in: high G+C Gram-positive bacteria) TaxID=192944 RepID=UPI003628B373